MLKPSSPEAIKSPLPRSAPSTSRGTQALGFEATKSPLLSKFLMRHPPWSESHIDGIVGGSLKTTNGLQMTISSPTFMVIFVLYIARRRCTLYKSRSFKDNEQIGADFSTLPLRTASRQCTSHSWCSFFHFATPGSELAAHLILVGAVSLCRSKQRVGNAPRTQECSSFHFATLNNRVAVHLMLVGTVSFTLPYSGQRVGITSQSGGVVYLTSLCSGQRVGRRTRCRRTGAGPPVVCCWERNRKFVLLPSEELFRRCCFGVELLVAAGVARMPAKFLLAEGNYKKKMQVAIARSVTTYSL
ncbi:hypothetical protein DM860_018109 [Cuscuta australis]|uniref:Uncharacterized protein n=1 Tax=Cuscuta australis TaxID=267555 RepID=A0A328E1N9_9ASTE|nr:hypothetical protein DM860_018109 [Cuscuta australis]